MPLSREQFYQGKQRGLFWYKVTAMTLSSCYCNRKKKKKSGCEIFFPKILVLGTGQKRECAAATELCAGRLHSPEAADLSWLELAKTCACWPSHRRILLRVAQGCGVSCCSCGCKDVLTKGSHKLKIF